MIKINLIAEAPAAAGAKRKRPEGAAAPRAGGVRKGDLILLLLLLVGIAVTGGRWYLLKQERDQLKRTEGEMRAERDRLQVFIKKVEELEAKRAALQHKIEVINNLKNNQTGPVRIMDEVSKALPELVWLEGLNLDGNNLSLQGQAMDENAVANYLANLDASPYFKEPTLLDMTRAGKNSFRFNLNCVFSPTPESAPGTETPAAPAGT
jgi:type IV pilus assembly protein PilN